MFANQCSLDRNLCPRWTSVLVIFFMGERDFLGYRIQDTLTLISRSLGGKQGKVGTAWNISFRHQAVILQKWNERIWTHVTFPHLNISKVSRSPCFDFKTLKWLDLVLKGAKASGCQRSWERTSNDRVVIWNPKKNQNNTRISTRMAGLCTLWPFPWGWRLLQAPVACCDGSRHMLPVRGQLEYEIRVSSTFWLNATLEEALKTWLGHGLVYQKRCNARRCFPKKLRLFSFSRAKCWQKVPVYTAAVNSFLPQSSPSLSRFVSCSPLMGFKIDLYVACSCEHAHGTKSAWLNILTPWTF